MYSRLRISIFLIILIFISSSCVVADNHTHQYNKLSPYVLKLTSAVQACVDRPDYYGLNDPFSGEDCLKKALKYNQHLINPFQALTVKVKHQNNCAIVLICDGQTTLFEDKGCTPKIDYNSTNDNEVRNSCNFTF